MTVNDLMIKAQQSGFSSVVELDLATIELLDDVRDMCSTNACGMYGKNWACPPACGDLKTCRQKISDCTGGIMVQTVGDIEDSWDFETMMEIEAKHKENFARLVEELTKETGITKEMDITKETDIAKGVNAAQGLQKFLPLGAGACTICKECAYPEAPCRFPEKQISSLEAYGILVSDLCKRNGMGYYYGSQKMAYTSCVLLWYNNE